jgi:pyrophosphate--fructose-6-phosphate 1-phosphotransferase
VGQRLAGPVKEWRMGGIPLTSMMNIERRKGKDVPVIKKASGRVVSVA